MQTSEIQRVKVIAPPHPGIDSFSRYLKKDFPWRKDWYCELLAETYTYTQVKEAMLQVKKLNPSLHRLLAYRWQTERSRNAIANALYMDPSTLKRAWDRATNLIVNRISNPDLSEDLDQIDLILSD